MESTVHDTSDPSKFNSGDIRLDWNTSRKKKWKDLMEVMRLAKVECTTSKGRLSSAPAKVQEGTPRVQTKARSSRTGIGKERENS